MHARPKLSLSHPERKGRSDPKFTNRRESGSEFYTLSFSKASLAYGTLFRMCNNTVISQPCIENSLIISLADNTNEIASLTAHLMSPFLSQLLVCCTILYLSRLIERRSGAGRAYREGTFLFTVGEGKAGAAYVHGDQGRATPSFKEVGFLETKEEQENGCALLTRNGFRASALGRCLLGEH